MRHVLSVSVAVILTVLLHGCGGGEGSGVLSLPGEMGLNNSLSSPSSGLGSRVLVRNVETADPDVKAKRGTAAQGGKRLRKRAGTITGTVTDLSTGAGLGGVRVRAVLQFFEPLPLYDSPASKRGKDRSRSTRARRSPVSSGSLPPIDDSGADAEAARRGFVFSARTQEDGSYTIDHVPQGFYVVSASLPGYENTSVSVQVRARKTTTVMFQLAKQAFGTLRGAVRGLNPDGSVKGVLGCADVYWYRREGGSGGGIVEPPIAEEEANAPDAALRARPSPNYTKTDDSGTFVFARVPVGRIVVNASRQGYGFNSVEVEVKENQTTTVDVNLPLQSATVTGVITDAATDAPLAGVLVMTEPQFYALTGGDVAKASQILRRRQAVNGAHCPPPLFELIGATDETGRYQFMVPIFDVRILPASQQGQPGVAADAARPVIFPPPEMDHVVIAFKPGYALARQKLGRLRIGEVRTVNFQLEKK